MTQMTIALAALVVLSVVGPAKADPPVLYTVRSVNSSVYATTPPLVVGNFSYVGGSNGYIGAQNITAGWGTRATMSTNLNHSGDPSTLFIISDTTFGVVQRSRVICLSLEDLSVKWSFDAGSSLTPYYSSGHYTFAPVVWNNTVFIGSYDNNMHAIDAVTGVALWTTALDNSANKQLAHCPQLEAVFCPSGGYVYALSTATGERLWRTPSQNTIQTVYYDHAEATLYAGSVGTYYLFNATDNGTLVMTLSGNGGDAYLQPVKHEGIVYLATGTYVVAYNASNATATTSQFTIGGSSATIKFWTWAMGTLWAQAEAYDTALFMVSPNASWVEYFKSSDGIARGIAYVDGYFLFSASYLYLVPATMGPQHKTYLWATSYTRPLTAVYSPLNNGTLLVANSGSLDVLVAIALDIASDGAVGVTYTTQDSISTVNIAVNGSSAFTCDYYYRCYAVNGTDGSGTTLRVSDTALSSHGGVALTQGNLFSARGYHMASMSTANFTTLFASGADGATLDSRASHPTVVGSDGNVYQACDSDVNVFNGTTGTLFKSIAQTPDFQLATYDGLIYFSHKTKFYAYDSNPSNTDPIWTKTNPKGHNYYATPLVYGGNVYIGDFYGYTYCYGRVSGALLWYKRVSSSNDQVYYLDAWNGYIFAYTSTFVTVYGMDTGTTTGIIAFDGSFQYQPLITPDGTMVALTNKIWAVDLTTNTTLYNSSAFSPSTSYPPVFANGALYWGEDSKVIVSDAYTGDILFVIASQSSISSRSLAVSLDNQTLWYGAGSSIQAASIGFASRFVTAKAAVNGNAPSSDKDTSKTAKLWIIGAVAGAVVVVVAVIVVQRKLSKRARSGGDGTYEPMA